MHLSEDEVLLCEEQVEKDDDSAVDYYEKLEDNDIVDYTMNVVSTDGKVEYHAGVYQVFSGSMEHLVISILWISRFNQMSFVRRCLLSKSWGIVRL